MAQRHPPASQASQPARRRAPARASDDEGPLRTKYMIVSADFCPELQPPARSSVSAIAAPFDAQVPAGDWARRPYRRIRKAQGRARSAAVAGRPAGGCDLEAAAAPSPRAEGGGGSRRAALTPLSLSDAKMRRPKHECSALSRAPAASHAGQGGNEQRTPRAMCTCVYVHAVLASTCREGVYAVEMLRHPSSRASLPEQQ